MTTITSDSESLAAFLATYRGIRTDNDSEPSFARLSRVLSAISNFRQSDSGPVVKPRRQVDSDRLGFVLGLLREGINSCRHDGRLLNVWTISGLKRNEVRTSAVLGWVLDCNGSHGFGSTILDELLRLLGEREGGQQLGDIRLGRNYSLSLEHCALGEMANRVDLAIEGENCVIFIEVKIDAGLGQDQLIRYLQTSKAKAVALKKPIFLVLFLSEAWPPQRPSEIICLRWSDVARAISKVVIRSPEKTVSGALLLQFAAHVKTLH